MKKGVIFLLTVIAILVSILMFCSQIQATGKTLESSMNIETTEIEQSKETTIYLKVNSNEKINAFQAKIIYNENVWEEIDENNFVVEDGWEGLKYNKENKQFIVINKEEEVKQNILKINFKVRNNANVGNTELAINEIIASDGKEELTSEKLSQEVSIKINESLIENSDKSTEPSKPETPSNTENIIENITEDEKNNIIVSNNTNKVAQKENLPSVLPKTGKSHILLFIIITLVILSIILYYKNKKYRKIMMLFIICGVLISQSTVFAASELFIGDINKSSAIDDEDIEIMQEYLIKLRNVTLLEQADMNSDGKLSIIDLSLLIKQQRECPYDKNNVTGITSWSAIPMVSKELLQKHGVTTGGEGCQWPIGMAISKDGNLLLYGTDVGGVYRSEDGGKSWNFTKMMLVKGHRDIREAISYDESSYNQEKNRCMVAYWSTAYETEDNYLEENEKGLYKISAQGAITDYYQLSYF